MAWRRATPRARAGLLGGDPLRRRRDREPRQRHLLVARAGRLHLTPPPDQTRQQRMMMLYMDPPLPHPLPPAREQGLHPSDDRASSRRACPALDRHRRQRLRAGRVRLRRGHRRRAAAAGHRRDDGRAPGGPHRAVRLVEQDDRLRRPRVRAPGARRGVAASCTCTATRSPRPRRENPDSTSSASLLKAEVDGDTLNELEFNLFFLLLTVAGNETTRNLIAHGMRRAHRAPRRARDGCARTRRCCRARSRRCCAGPLPVMYFRRTATGDTELGGQQIKEGDKVVICYISANRDERCSTPRTVRRRPLPQRARRLRRRRPALLPRRQPGPPEISIMFAELLDRIPT